MRRIAETPLVSVVMATYNRAAYIADAIRSVQDQAYDSVEIIIADDGSTDGTPEIVSQFGRAVTYLQLPHRGQPAATRNAALETAKGEYVAFLDSDDLFLPGRLAQQVSVLAQYPDAGLAYSNGYFFRDDPEQPTGHVLDGLPTPSGEAFADLLRGNFLSSPVVLIRRSCLDTVGTFDERPEFFAVEDYDLWLRIAARFPLIYVPGDVAAIRRHGESISRDVAALRTGVIQVLAKLQASHPELTRQYQAALYEGYARNHGAVALSRFRQGQVSGGFWHSIQALRYSLGTPGWGARALLQWLRRRRVRGTGAVP
jgi:glycosyltransferase involved in cell wall biosynthesis